MKVGILGFGNVGGGVGTILLSEMQKNANFPFQIEKIIVRDISKCDMLGLPSSFFSENIDEVITNADIDVVIEVMGGTKIAKESIIKALNNKKHVITANKALLAESGNELFALAQKNNVFLKFEASVGGGIPIIRTLQTHYHVGTIQKVSGIVNGTCNFILSEIEKNGSDYATTLKSAQEKGFAESDPTFDTEGFDAAQKLAIIAHLAFGIPIPDWKLADISGISALHKADFAFAKSITKRIRLIVTAEIQENGSLFLSVSPKMVPEQSTLGSVCGPTNVITIQHEYLGEMALIGAGAGRYPTAMSVISDLFSLLQNEKQMVEREKNIPLTPNPSAQKSFYFRFFVEDKPGVLAKIAEIFGQNSVSISEIKNAQGQDIPMSILTYPILHSQKMKLLQDISSLSVIKGSVACLEVQ